MEKICSLIQALMRLRFWKRINLESRSGIHHHQFAVNLLEPNPTLPLEEGRGEGQPLKLLGKPLDMLRTEVL